MGIIITFRLERLLAQDPFYVLLTRPKDFYTGLRSIFAEGAEIIIDGFVKGLREKCNIKLTLEEFLSLMSSEDEKSRERLRKIWMRLIESYNHRRNKSQPRGPYLIM